MQTFIKSNTIAINYKWKIPIKLIDVDNSLNSHDGESNITLFTHTFDNNSKEYYIISYVWSLNNKFSICEVYRNKHIKRKILSCKLTSFIAMLYICKQMCIKYVWIDVVCVDHEDINIKSLQLSEMGYYYYYAKECLVFANGLDMYAPFTYQQSLGPWYDRVWTVQECAFTKNKKVFVHILPYEESINLENIVQKLEIKKEHDYLISEFLKHNNEAVPNWYLCIVREENYNKLIGEWANISNKCKLCWCHWQAGIYVSDKSKFTLGLSRNDVSKVIRSALTYRTGCKYSQDRLYSIVNLLGIEIDISYDISLKEAIVKASSMMDSKTLVSLITATWYSTEGNTLPDSTEYAYDSRLKMGISNCITNVRCINTGICTEICITTKSKIVNIERVHDIGFYSSQRVVLGQYPTYGHPFLVDSKIKVRGEVNIEDNKQVKLLYMGKSITTDFFVNENNKMTGSECNEIPANVCLVVDAKGSRKIGVLYIPEYFEFEIETKSILKG